jgi:hypothetical protein
VSLQAQLTAQLVTGPSSVSDSQFPSGVATISFGLNPSQWQYTVATGAVVNVNSPSSPVTIDAIGTGGQVTQGVFFYARCASPMVMVLTEANPSGGTVIATIELNGPFLCQFPSNGYLQGVTIQGSGQFEYWCAGPQ